MRKLLLILALIATTTGAFAQLSKGDKSAVVNAGFKTDPMRFLVGVQGRYNILDNIRIAPDVTFIFPKNKTTGLDINVNAHYVFDLSSSASGLSVYPLAGIAMMNYRISSFRIGDYKVPSTSGTEFGFNLGAGASYDLNDSSFLNAELKYTFSDFDDLSFSIGYGFRF